jgi:hypothetical protein
MLLLEASINTEEHMTLADFVIEIMRRRPGITDRQLAEAIFGTPQRVQQINSECRHLENIGRLERKKVGDEPIGNWPLREKPLLRVV